MWDPPPPPQSPPLHSPPWPSPAVSTAQGLCRLVSCPSGAARHLHGSPAVGEPSLGPCPESGGPSLAPCPERGEPSLAPCPERGPPHPELSVARPCHRCPFAHPVCLSCYCFICLSHSWNILSFVRAETSLIFLRFCTFSACRRAWDTCRAQGPFQGARSSLRLRKGLSGRGPPCLCPSPRAGGLEGTAGGPDPEPVGHASVHRSLLSDSRFVQTQNEDEPAVLPE